MEHHKQKQPTHVGCFCVALTFVEDNGDQGGSSFGLGFSFHPPDGDQDRPIAEYAVHDWVDKLVPVAAIGNADGNASRHQTVRDHGERPGLPVLAQRTAHEPGNGGVERNHEDALQEHVRDHRIPSGLPKRTNEYGQCSADDLCTLNLRELPIDEGVEEDQRQPTGRQKRYEPLEHVALGDAHVGDRVHGSHHEPDKPCCRVRRRLAVDHLHKVAGHNAHDRNTGECQQDICHCVLQVRRGDEL